MIVRLKPDFSAKKAIVEAEIAEIQSLKISKETKRRSVEMILKRYKEWAEGLEEACNGLCVDTDEFMFVKD